MKRTRDMKFPDNGFEKFGGYMQAKITKLEGQYAHQSKTKDNKISDIFAGISIFVNGFTRPSADELKTLMSQHGGVYHHYHRKDIDYVIASNLPDTKVKRLTNQKIVKPEWITDSITASKLLNYEEYLLYTRRNRLQPQLSFETGQKLKHNKLLKEEVSGIYACANGIENSLMGKEFEIKSENTTFSHSNDYKGDHNIEHYHINQFKEVPIVQESYTTTTKIAKIARVTLEKIDDSTFEKPESINRFKDLESNQPSEGHSSAVNDKTFHNSTVISLLARTAVDPKFLGEYYNNSRLHHISQLGAGFKQYINDIRDSREDDFPLRNQLKENVEQLSKQWNFEDNSTVPCKNENAIMHIDMDCFFVSVGLRTRPELRGHPVAVTHAKNSSTHKPQNRLRANTKIEFNMYKQRKMNNLLRSKGDLKNSNLPPSNTDDISDDEGSDFGSMSEIASCSYEARALGLKNGMFMGAALKLCPNLKTIPYDFDKYKSVAFTLYDTVAQYTLDIEAVSCDEMYVDCTSLLKEINITPMQFAKALREEIMQKTGCPCSTGFGSNRLQARLATKKAKPNGQYYLQRDFVDCFMSDIPLSELPGVGRQTQCKLSSLGFTKCGTLLSANLSLLQRHFGTNTGLQLYQSSRGIDEKPLNFTTVRKSVSAEVNYGIRFQDYEQCEIFVKQLCAEVHNRLVNFKVIGKAITFKLMVRAADAPVETAKFMGHGFCDNIAKTVTLNKATNDLNIITLEVLNIVRKIKAKPEEMRGIGIQISKLESVTSKPIKKGALDTFLNFKSRNISKELNEIENRPSSNRYQHSEMQPTTPIKLELTDTPKKTMSCEINQNEASVENALKLIMSPLKDRLQVSPIKISKSPKKHPVGSPSRKRNLGMTARRRGRPPKNKNFITKDNSLGAMSIFLQKKKTGNDNRDNMNLSGIDHEFLNALPEDLKDEVIREHKQNKVKQNKTESVEHKTNFKEKASQQQDSPNESIKIDEEFLAALPQELRAEIETEYKLKLNHNNKKISNIDARKMKCDSASANPLNLNENSNIHGIFNMHWRKIREMLRAWLQCEKTPLTCDIDIMAIYMQNMVINKDIDDLSCLLRFLHRNVNSLSKCEWHKVYNHIAGSVQESMVEVYEGQLLLPNLFTCCR